MHPDGYFQLKDRSKDIIISGGENISTLEVESILLQHEKILEVREGTDGRLIPMDSRIKSLSLT